MARNPCDVVPANDEATNSRPPVDSVVPRGAPLNDPDVLPAKNTSCAPAGAPTSTAPATPRATRPALTVCDVRIPDPPLTVFPCQPDVRPDAPRWLSRPPCVPRDAPMHGAGRLTAEGSTGRRGGAESASGRRIRPSRFVPWRTDAPTPCNHTTLPAVDRVEG